MHGGDALFELIRKLLLVEEDIGIAEALIEAVFHLFYALHYPREVTVACEYDDRRVGSTVQHKGRIIRPVVLLRDHIWFVRWRFLGSAEQARD